MYAGSDTQARFRRRPDDRPGLFRSVCLRCFRTVCFEEAEDRLHHHENSHRCEQHALDRLEDARRLVKAKQQVRGNVE